MGLELDLSLMFQKWREEAHSPGSASTHCSSAPSPRSPAERRRPPNSAPPEPQVGLPNCFWADGGAWEELVPTDQCLAVLDLAERSRPGAFEGVFTSQMATAPEAGQHRFGVAEFLTSRLFPYAELDVSELVYALALLQRVAPEHGVLLGPAPGPYAADKWPKDAQPNALAFGWCSGLRLMLAAVVVALKLLRDHHLANSYMAQVGGVPPAELATLERALLTGLGWRAQVSPGEFWAVNAALKSQ